MHWERSKLSNFSNHASKAQQAKHGEHSEQASKPQQAKHSKLSRASTASNQGQQSKHSKASTAGQAQQAKAVNKQAAKAFSRAGKPFHENVFLRKCDSDGYVASGETDFRIHVESMPQGLHASTTSSLVQD